MLIKIIVRISGVQDTKSEKCIKIEHSMYWKNIYQVNDTNLNLSEDKWWSKY